MYLAINSEVENIDDIIFYNGMYADRNVVRYRHLLMVDLTCVFWKMEVEVEFRSIFCSEKLVTYLLINLNVPNYLAILTLRNNCRADVQNFRLLPIPQFKWKFDEAMAQQNQWPLYFVSVKNMTMYACMQWCCIHRLGR